MNTRQALTASLATEPDVLAITIATQRKQLSDHLLIAERAWAQEDLETWARAARHAANVKKALEENLEMQKMRVSDLSQFTASALVAQALKEALAGDAAAAKAIADAAKRIAKKPGGARVRG